MSEVQSRPSAPRGRGSARGGRGGYSSRGGRGGPRHANGEKAATLHEDEGEIGLLKKQYASKLSTIKEMFPDWTSEDIVFALEETDGDLEGTIERISEGNITQWGEVKKKTKDRARPNVKDSTTTGNEPSNPSGRGGRGRGVSDGPRGGRGRTTDRGRGAGRGTRGANANSSKPRHSEKAAQDLAAETSTVAMVGSTSSWETPAGPTEATGDNWDQSAVPESASPDASSWEIVATPLETAPPSAEPQRPSLRPDGTRSWASMLKPVPIPTPVHARPKAAPKVPNSEVATEQKVAPESSTLPSTEHGLPPPAPKEEAVSNEANEPTSPVIPTASPALTPSKDELTKTNLEQVLDTSAPAPTATAASTVASTNDPRSTTTTPLPASGQHQSTLRPGLSGFATSAYKATAGSTRTPSFQRRVMEQQEAVVMPGNHAVDRAAVQFGSMGLNGSSEDLDVDDDREEAETRTQPPQQSPVAPRASLPPVPLQPAEAAPTPRAAPGLPPAAPHAALAHSSAPEQQASQASQSSHPYNQFNNRYGPLPSQQDTVAPASKPYEPFGQQIQQPSSQPPPYDNYSSLSQAPSQQPQPAQQSQPGAYSSSANGYSLYYTADNYRNQFYNSYGQSGQQSQQDAGASQQRTGSAFGSSGAEQPSQYAISQTQQHPQARYATAVDAQASGHSTPNPLPGQQGHVQPQQSHQIGQPGHGQVGGAQGAYPYGQPYYNNSSYYPTTAYMNQYGYGGNQAGYGSGPYGGAGGKYGQPHQAYGMSPQSSYDHQSAASPANAGGYGQQPHSMPGRDTSAVGSYGRTGSTQPSENQQHGGAPGAFGGMPDVFGRSQSGFAAQNSQPSGPQGGNDEPSRGYGDASKVPGGPSPAPGQSGRPGSAANNMQNQSGIPTSQAQSQQGYNAYPQMHSQQYGTGLGGVGGHHQTGAQNQGGAYGGYGTGFGGNYYGTNSRGGWGGSYGH